MSQLYCFVQNGAVAQGPSELPFAFGNKTGFDKVADPTLYGWYPYSDPGAPTINSTTQQIIRSYIINNTAKTVTQAYSVGALPLPQIQTNQNGLILQSHQAKLHQQASAAANAGDTQTATQYLLQVQGTKP